MIQGMRSNMQHIDEIRRTVKAATTAACVLLALALFGGAAPAQQASGGQTPQALPLPTSGRSAQSLGQVTTQQTTLPVGTSVVQPSVTVIGNYQGSVQGASVADGPLRLSMAEAVKRGLQTNLGVITSDVVSSTVRAQRMQVLSQMLPQISASAGESVMQLNLASYGFNAISSAIPSVIGPFQYVQAQANFNWSALSLTNFRNVQAANAVDRATQLSARDARELVVLAVGGSYLQVVSTAAQIESQRRQVDSAQAVYDRANTRLTAGTNTRVDLTRSLVQLQAEQERLLSLEGDYQQQKIALARVIGLPQNTDIVLTEPLEPRELPAIDEAEVLHSAFEHRFDLCAAESQRTAAERALSAARGERLPSVSFNGYYGASGTHPNASHGNFAAQGTVNVPIFDGGRISGDIRQAQATLRQRQAEYTDQKEKVEQDVRNALIQLRVSAGQVKLAESNRQYAQETLTQSQDRFEAGVTNTVEVVQAQQQQASAENDYISSLFAWNLARLSLARAIGDAETQLTTLFPGEKH
jgi:outer membrane protein TolC